MFGSCYLFAVINTHTGSMDGLLFGEIHKISDSENQKAVVVIFFSWEGNCNG